MDVGRDRACVRLVADSCRLFALFFFWSRTGPFSGIYQSRSGNPWDVDILAVPLSTIGILVGVVFWAIARTGREAPETSN
jgi:hypothetical protein